MTKSRTATLAGVVAFSALVLIGATTDAPAQGRRTTDTVTGSCVFAYGTASCVRQYRYNDAGNTGIIQIGKEKEEADAESRERERLWVSRCRPTLRQDALGVSRYVYAAPGCEFGRFSD